MLSLLQCLLKSTDNNTVLFTKTGLIFIAVSYNILFSLDTDKMLVTYCAFACEHWAVWVIHGTPNGPPVHVLLLQVPPGHEWWNQEAMYADGSYNYQLCSMLEPHYCLKMDKILT